MEVVAGGGKRARFLFRRNSLGSEKHACPIMSAAITTAGGQGTQPVGKLHREALDIKFLVAFSWAEPGEAGAGPEETSRNTLNS